MKNILEIINTGTAAHYSWGENCDGWHLVKNDELSVIKEKMPPGTTEVMHYHQKSRQFFYILSGKASIETEGKTHVLLPGDGLEIPPLVSHRMFNQENEELEFLVISQPKSHGDRIEAVK